jgi:hypothetical protein
MMHVFVRSTFVVMMGCVSAARLQAQAPPLVFTVAAPERASTEITVHASPVVEDRGLTLWSGGSSDVGVGVDVSGRNWSIRSISSATTLPIANHLHPTFQQVEVVRSLLSIGSISVAGGGGVRQDWDGARVLIGRALAGASIAGGRLQGSVVVERAFSSLAHRDAADVVTSVGWSRQMGHRLALGVEGIGQDLEGFWNPAEADGGAKLLLGPSIHMRSTRGDWTGSATAGPVFLTPSTMSSSLGSTRVSPSGRHRFGFFASASWLPSRR